MKNRLITFAVSITLLLFLSPSMIASAHVLKVNGSIGAVLHIEPDDNPTVGQHTKYTLLFSDQMNRLDLTKCNCTLAVQENGNTIYSRSMRIANPTASVDSYTFEKPGIYILQFSGTPKKENLFQPFSLNYTIRVAGGANTQPFPTLLWIGIGLGMGLVVLAAFAMDYNDKEAKQSKRGKS